MYSAAVLDHFKNPRNAGELLDATVEVESSNPVCGDILSLAARVEGSRVVGARFKAQGCVTTVAAASYLTEWMTGKTIQEARGLKAEQVSEALGGLPQATFHGAQLAAETLSNLLRKIP